MLCWKHGSLSSEASACWVMAWLSAAPPSTKKDLVSDDVQRGYIGRVTRGELKKCDENERVHVEIRVIYLLLSF